MTDSSQVENAINARILHLFPTLVAEFDHPDPAELNNKLAVLARKIRDEAKLEQRPTTINHGWRSKSDLLEQDIPEIRLIRKFFDRSIGGYIKQWVSSAGTANIPKTFTHRYKGWAVILSEGGYQQQHVHSRTDLVGVYCVELPAAQSDNQNVGGALTLVDPRTGRLSTCASWESDLTSLQPVPGRLFMFPSYVAHRVEALLAPGERITINFDVVVQGSS